MEQLIIIGAGAAGLAAAITAADIAPGAKILLLEGLEKPGKKLLATGNGRCNLTNEVISPERYHSADPERLAELLADMPTGRILSFFEDLGLLCAPDEAGRVYPACRQAAMVLDVLLLGLKRRPGITLRTGCKVKELHPIRRGFSLTAESGEVFQARSVLLTAGGCAAPKQGSDGSGLRLAEELGLTCVPPRPCLVPLRCEGKVFRSLKGIRAQCGLSLWENGRKLGEERGEVQFTDYGLSGIPAMQLSCLLGRKNEAQVDFFPDWRYSDLREELAARLRRYPTEPVEDALLGLLNRRLQYAVLKSCGISPTLPAQELSRRELETLTAALKGWRFPVLGTLGWEHAQVTSGGVSLTEIGDDFSARRVPGLYLAGEILDAAGDCGGYNLHWAWCSGMTAGAAAARLFRK